MNGVLAEAREKGLPVLEFSTSVKSRESFITKLLAKKENVAAQVYDKTRFRIVTRTRADILPTLYFLTQRLFPFNFVVPGQTENSLLPFKSLLRDFPHFSAFAEELHLDPDFEAREGSGWNEFSGSNYRVLNFVVDVPLRLDEFLPPPAGPPGAQGTHRFTLVEFQLMDARTAETNEQGTMLTPGTSTARSSGCSAASRAGWWSSLGRPAGRGG